jgi:capsular polysaccharide transport system ATP-binding protein
MIELRNLTKYYPTERGRKYVFRDLNVTFPGGHSIGVLGRNGAGKSTMLRILGGLEAPDSGEVVCDESISWPVGLSGGFQGSLTARDNVRFVCRVFGATGAEQERIIKYVEDFAEIGDYFDLPVGIYSHGMKSRVTFGTSMAFDFDYYLIDEVMAVGDPIFRKKSSQVFKQKLEGASVILVSHNLKEVAEMCDSAIVVERGSVKVFDDVQEGITYYQEMLKGIPTK